MTLTFTTYSIPVAISSVCVRQLCLGYHSFCDWRRACTLAADAAAAVKLKPGFHSNAIACVACVA